jgi:iron complex transport system substrate-binding protein
MNRPTRLRRPALPVIAFAVFTAVMLQGYGAFAGCINDDTGVEVCLDGPPTRVVSLYGAFTETLWELGAGGAMVGRTKNDTTIGELAELPVVGSGLRPDVEYLLALRPQLVISRASKAAGAALEAMRGRAITVAAFDPRSLEELYSVAARLGVLLGREGEAKELVEKLKEQLERVRKVSMKAKSVPTLAFEIRAEPLTVAGSKGLLNELVEVAGGKNGVRIEKKLVRLDMEALLALDPDYYFIQRGPMNKNPLPPEQRPHHASLTAVKKGLVHVVDEKLFSRPGPRVGEAAEALSRIFHPELW